MTPYAGVIEGFFGREWSWEDRIAYADFLAHHHFDFYIYAPKGDRYLRQHWNQDWPEETWRQLHEMREAYRLRGVAFGLGLSPFDVQQNYDQAARQALLRKTERLNELDPDILCILFDDMKGDLADLATVQTDMAHLICGASRATRHIVCPSYYSDDPVLEKVFGQAPPNYLEDLGKLLDPKLDIFWTGPLVCSTEYPREHLESVARRLGRKPFLWDNYPVNDGAKKSNHLHLRPFRPHPIADLVTGHAVNPMNQAWLSRLPLLTFEASYGLDYDAARAWSQALRALDCPAELVARLEGDVADFQDRGLLELSASELAESYRTLPDHPYRTEVVEWLTGKYEFDPACLTD
jgi:hyaluronoglucosaminidase